LSNEFKRKKLEEDLKNTIPENDETLDAEEAFAFAIRALVGDKKSIKSMAYLKNDLEASKIGLMFMMSRRRGLGFLREATFDRLLLSRSINKGVGSRQVVEGLRNMNGFGGDEKLSVTERVKGALKRDFVRE
jgi:hypothetical protein